MPLATRTVTVKITTEDGKDNGAVPCLVELDRGAGHVRVRGKDVTCNMEEATFDLAPGERLVIHGHTADAIAYDKDQHLAYVKKAQEQGLSGADDPNKNKAPQTKPPAQPAITPVPKTKEEAIDLAKKQGMSNPEASAKIKWPQLFEAPKQVEPPKPAQDQSKQTGGDQKK